MTLSVDASAEGLGVFGGIPLPCGVAVGYLTGLPVDLIDGVNINIIRKDVVCAAAVLNNVGKLLGGRDYNVALIVHRGGGSFGTVPRGFGYLDALIEATKGRITLSGNKGGVRIK